MTARQSRPRESGLGVRSKLIALVLILLIPVFVLNGVSVWLRFDSRVTHELEESDVLAEAISSSLLNYLENLWNMEVAVGEAILMHAGHNEPHEIDAMLADTADEIPTVLALHWVDPAGITLASSLPEAVGLSVADREYYQRILAGEDKVVSDVLVGRATGQPTVAVVRALRRDGKLVGLLVAGFDLAKLDSVLPGASAEGRQFGFLDCKGRIVYNNVNPELDMSQRETPPDMPGRRALSGEAFWNRSFRASHDGLNHMGVSIPIKPIGWAFYSTLPRSVIMDDIWPDTLVDLTVLLLIAAISLVLALYLGRSILHPILALQRAAKAITAGDLSARVGLSGTDEVAAAARAFDSMAGRIQLADEVLKARVTAVARLSQQALAGADIAALSDAAAALVALSLGVEAAAVLEIYPTMERYRICATVGLPDRLTGRTVDTGYRHLAAAVYEHQEPTVFEDVSGLLGFDVPAASGAIACAALAPIAVQNLPFGGLVVFGTRPRQFTQSDLHFLQAVANVVATANEQKRAEAEQAFLVRAGSALASSLEIEETLAHVAELVTESIADWCIVDLQSGDTPRRIVRSSRPDSAPVAAALDRLISTDPPSWQRAQERLKSGEPMIRPHITDDVLAEAAGSDAEFLAVLRSMRLVASIVVPLIARDRVMGMISFMTSGPSGYDRRDLQLMQELARRASLAADHAQMYREATRLLAERDQALASAETERSRLHTLFDQAPALIAMLHGPSHVFTLVNPMYQRAVGAHRKLVGRAALEVMPELVHQGFRTLLDGVYKTGTSYEGREVRVMLQRTEDGPLEEMIFNFVYHPMLDAAGQTEGIFVFAVDVTEQVRARRQVETLAADFRTVARQQAAVATLGQRLIGGADLESVLAEAVALVTATLGADACRVLELQPDGLHLRVRTGTGWSGDDVILVEEEPGVLSMAGYTLRSEQPVIIDDLRRDSRFGAWQTLRNRGVVSGMSVVIAGDETPFGTLAVVNLAHRTYTQDDVNFLTAVAHVLSQALLHQRDKQRLGTQHEVARILAEAQGETTVGLQILKALGEGLGWDVGLFWKIDAEVGVAQPADTWQAPGVDASEFLRESMLTKQRGQGLVGMAWERATPIWFTDVALEPRFLRLRTAAQMGLHGALLIPVLFGGEVLGVIECFSREVRRPDPAAVQMATTVGAQVG
ncbi:MAG TPA: GAF domain-containing protein, partial [Symbiobacteriaceae bacterium]|nr:GAF domain-containing protein [Symbiobacteriaceae bacterium]